MGSVSLAILCIYSFWKGVEDALRPSFRTWATILKVLPLGKVYDWAAVRYDFFSDHLQWAMEESDFIEGWFEGYAFIQA